MAKTTKTNVLRLTVASGESAMRDEGLIAQANETIERSYKDIVSKVLAIGRALKKLKAELISLDGQPDRIGWKKAFERGMVAHGSMSRSTADKYIEITDFFDGPHTVSTDKLPPSWGTLHAIASGFKGAPEKLEKALNAGIITVASTRKDVTAAAVKLGAKKPGKAPLRKPPATRDAPMEERIAAVFAFMEKLGVKLEDIDNHFSGE